MGSPSSLAWGPTTADSAPMGAVLTATPHLLGRSGRAVLGPGVSRAGRRLFPFTKSKGDGGRAALCREGVGFAELRDGTPEVLSPSCSDCTVLGTLLPVTDLANVQSGVRISALATEVSLLRCSLRPWEGTWGRILASRYKPGYQSL